MRQQEPDIRYRITHVLVALAAVGVTVVAALLSAGAAAFAATDEVTATTANATVAGPPLQLFGLPVAAALWLLAGVVAATAGLLTASRRPRLARREGMEASPQRGRLRTSSAEAAGAAH